MSFRQMTTAPVQMKLILRNKYLDYLQPFRLLHIFVCLGQGIVGGIGYDAAAISENG